MEHYLGELSWCEELLLAKVSASEEKIITWEKKTKNRLRTNFPYLRLSNNLRQVVTV